MSKKLKKIFMAIGEVSGDMYGAAVIKALNEKNSDEVTLDIKCLGGDRMRRENVDLLYNSVTWSAIGLIEAFKRAPKLYLIFLKLKKIIREWKPDVIVLVDYPGFNMFLVRYAKKLGIPTLYYFPPAKWAEDPKDVEEAANCISTVAATFKSTYDLYKAANGNVEFVGHPLIDIVKPKYEKEKLIRSIGFDPDKPIVGLLPGSRYREVKELLPHLREMSSFINKKVKDVQFVVPLALDTYDTIKNCFCNYNSYMESWQEEVNLKVLIDMTYDVMNISDVMIVASGTATLEASILEKPIAIIYKVSQATETLARLTRKFPPFFGAPNLIMGKCVVPEFLQKDLQSDVVASEIISMIQDKEKNKRIKSDLKKVRKMLGKPGSASRVAD
ncbi:lipid-A-disaccharide synthase, partial [bacterium]|nr:lipid-A-disaccharide synthase [bacterium]